MAEDRSIQLSELTLDDFKTLHIAFEPDVIELWNYEKSIENRSARGGTSRSAVQRQIQILLEWLQ